MTSQPPTSPWSDSWWYATQPLETLMWDAKTSTKSLRLLIKTLGDAHKGLGQSYADNANRKIPVLQTDTFGTFWGSMMENTRRRSQVHLQCGQFLCEHANMLQEWRYAQSKQKRAVFAKIKVTESVYEKAKQKVQSAKRKYVSACNRAKRAIQKRDRNLSQSNGTTHSKASAEQDQLRVDQALREVKSEQMQYESSSGDLMRAYLEYRAKMKEHMNEFQKMWKHHCERLKNSMEEVVKIEEAIAHQGKVLTRDNQDSLKRLDVQKDISLLVNRNGDLISEPAKVMCIRRESLAIKNARKRFNVPEKRYKRTKPKNVGWTARFASMFSGDTSSYDTDIDQNGGGGGGGDTAASSDNPEKKNLEKNDRVVDVTMTEENFTKTTKKKDEYISLTPRTQAQLVLESPDGVEEDQKEEEEIAGKDQEQSKIMMAVALYPFEGRDASELTFGVGARIQIVSAEGDWWEGIYRGDRGEFPKNYVTLVDKKSGLADRTSVKETVYRAAHDFSGRDSTELTVTAGSLVKIKSSGLEDWVMAMTSSGDMGLVPTNYLEKVSDEEA